MKIKDRQIIKSLLGDDIFHTLEKYEIYKPETRSVVDPEEMRVALQIVPRAVLAFLFSHLKWREQGDSVDIDLPFAANAQMHIDKKGPDNYHGEIIKDGKVISKFQHRSLPSIGLMLLTTFELYDLSMLDEIKQKHVDEDNSKIDRLQELIEERMGMHRLIQDVVDQRISEREAIDRLIKERLNSHIQSTHDEYEEEPEEYTEVPEEMEISKKSKLREFLDNREKKRQESVEMDKSEISCPDCGTSLYKSEGKKNIKLCVCYGEHVSKEIKFKKTEKGQIKLKFPKSFDMDNIEMLLDALKGKGV